ncbi:MAG: patatin-like phospholipase family protein [Archangium sp.]|nr:patatin-like phospholipase family protein [Archangium sp.]
MTLSPLEARVRLLERLRGRRVGVVLSAGYFGFYGHAGFVEGLLASGITPSAWAGTSAGGMVAAFVAAGLPPARIAELILAQRREHFWDPDYLGIAVDAVRRGSRPSGLLKGERFVELLRQFLPVHDFEALATPLVLVATNLSTQAPEVMQTGELASAVHATCAYPGLFRAVRRQDHLLWDGGIVDKAPALALWESRGKQLDVLLVHFLPSRDGAKEPSGALAYASGMANGFAAIRKDHFRLQLALLEARGVEVHVVTSRLPGVSPNEMHKGPDAVSAGRASIIEALGKPPGRWTGED